MMRFNPRFTVAVDVLSPGTTEDPYSGELVESWDTPVRRRVNNVLVYMGASEETSSAPAPHQSFTRLTAILPYGDPVSRRDRVEVLSGPYAGTYIVDGRPAHWMTPWSGWQAGTEVHLEESTGV